jgi:DNA processing protein
VTYTEACLAINMIPKVGPVRMRKLLDSFGEPQNILRASADRLQGVDGVGPEIARNIVAWESHADIPAELERMREAGIQVLTQQSEHYPTHLRNIHDPPIVLYVWGELTERDRHAIGIVGSRKTSHYGTETAKKLSYQLAFAGLTVFSGLARGIDTAAHQGALAAKGRTVAVMGCGLCQIYPPENFELAERIASGNGAVISEFPMATTPDKQTFPMRNRIISGCSLGLLVVEAGLNSGALISAGQAGDQGRSVFAVPGQIDRPTSHGSNRLIQQGAKLVMDAEDILEELPELRELFTRSLSEQSPAASVPSPLLAGLKPTEAAVYAAIDDVETSIDQIILKCGLPTPAVSSTLFTLELKKLIKQLPGKHYVKLF